VQDWQGILEALAPGSSFCSVALKFGPVWSEFLPMYVDFRTCLIRFSIAH
jgi:hypothetical protein